MIPTAKDFYDRMKKSDMPIELIMQGFAKRHVREALEQASENSKAIEVLNDDISRGYRMKNILCVCKDSIINAYPLTNIK